MTGAHLKPKTINARFLLKSYQPIHRLINSSSKIKINSLKLKNEIIMMIGVLKK
jgi:hypothetical protein